MPSSHLILCLSLLLCLAPPSIRVFSNESTHHMRWPKYWSFSFSISPSNKHPGLISFRMDWLNLLAVQGTLESLLQHHSSKASIFRCSVFFTSSYWNLSYKFQHLWLWCLKSFKKKKNKHNIPISAKTSYTLYIAGHQKRVSFKKKNTFLLSLFIQTQTLNT